VPGLSPQCRRNGEGFGRVSFRCFTRRFYERADAVVIVLRARQSAPVEIIAHRGAAADAPENTLASMKLAWEQGADAIELDVWLSKDGKLVVFHDADTKRFESKPRKISRLTWKEIQQLDVGAWKGAQFEGERVPTLESVLATIPPKRRAIIEIKCGAEIIPELSRVLRASRCKSEQVAIINFDFAALQESKTALPRLQHYFLHDYRRSVRTGLRPKLAPLVARTKEAGLDGIDLSSQWPITASFVSKVKAAGLKLFVWTVDDAALAKRLADAGVDGITTNRPKWLREQLSLGDKGKP